MFQLENSILELLVDNLKRLNETEESDRQGVFHILGMLASFVRVSPLTRLDCRHLRESGGIQ